MPGKKPRDLLNPKAVVHMLEIFAIKDKLSKKETREISAQFGITLSQVLMLHLKCYFVCIIFCDCWVSERNTYKHQKDSISLSKFMKFSLFYITGQGFFCEPAHYCKRNCPVITRAIS